MFLILYIIVPKKGYMYKEIAEIKDWIRGYFMNKIDEYAFDNVFPLDCGYG